MSRSPPPRSLELSYRLIGIAHFIGFLALFNALRVLRPSRAPALPGWAGVTLQMLFAAVAALSVRTYWHAPDYSGIPAASITPAHLVDLSRLYLPHCKSRAGRERRVARQGRVI